LGRRYRLCADWGSMQYWYQHPDKVEAMAIAYHSGKPIGMAMLMRKGYGLCGVRFGVFVRSYMRRQGIGSQLVSLVRKRADQKFIVAKYDDQQKAFYNSMGIKGLLYYNG